MSALTQQRIRYAWLYAFQFKFATALYVIKKRLQTKWEKWVAARSGCR